MITTETALRQKRSLFLKFDAPTEKLEVVEVNDFDQYKYMLVITNRKDETIAYEYANNWKKALDDLRKKKYPLGWTITVFMRVDNGFTKLVKKNVITK